MASGAGQRSARHPVGIERVTLDGEAAGQKPMLLLWSQQRITEKIESLLVITKLDSVFETHPTVQDAVASFR
jgi:hypothetical protein